MKWQNLIDKKCPSCEAEMHRENVSGFQCSSGKCSFFITDRSYAQILMDPTHNLRRWVTQDQSEKLSEMGRQIERATLEIVLK